MELNIILIKASQLILSLSILIVLHELGHFIPARLFKTRVEKFYLFFDPWFSLVKKKVGDTVYGIGWLPLGGYVKISGMIDESMDKEQMAKPPQPWEFRSKPAWQRLIIMLGGVTVNFLLGIFIYAMVLYVWGDPYYSNKDLVSGVQCSDFAKKIGFKDGDKIISIDGEKTTRFSKVLESMLLNDDSYVVVVERDGLTENVTIEKNFIKHWKNSGGGDLFAPAATLKITGFTKKSNAEGAGFLIDDVLVSVNEVEGMYNGGGLISEIQKNKGKTIDVGVKRMDSLIHLSVGVNNDGMVGIEFIGAPRFSLDTFSFISSIPAGYNKAKEKLLGYVAQFGLIFNSENDLAREIGGFGAIGGLFPEKWNWQAFWNLTAFLSIMLAFLNLLPIPALDGGHVVFLLYEMVVGRPAPEKVLEYAQIIGFVLLMGLVIFANGNDILKLF